MSSAPQSIGRYQVIRLLGEGGMGAVYLCQDPLLKRQVAVKTVREGRSNSSEMLERFQRESEISARLNHPNIVTVFDVGDDPEMGPFMTMEYVDGSSLSSYIQAGPVQPEEAIGLLAQGALALGASAKAGVVHRDIKPENMLVSREGVLKLTDFGVAKEEESTSTSLTTTGMLVGTPTHTAPELLQGDKASPATDRYAFAVTAFQLMAHGDLPHKGATLHALMSHIVNSDAELPPDMPSGVARVFLKALHRDPGRRYGTVGAFLDDLAEAYGVAAPQPAPVAGRALAAPMGGDMVTQDMPTPADFAPAATAIRSARPRAAHHDSGQRLVGPPSGLFKAGEGGDDLPPPAELAKQIRLGMLAPTQHAVAGRINLPPIPAAKPNSHKGLIAAVLIAVGAYAGWNYLHSRQAAEAVAPAAAQEALPGFAALTTDPPNAKVFLGGELIGTTPMDVIAIPPKPQDIRIELKGYKTWTGRIGPQDKLPASVKLEPQS